eukprot:10821645-Heterocapsa_arctica.AAC.1
MVTLGSKARERLRGDLCQRNRSTFDQVWFRGPSAESRPVLQGTYDPCTSFRGGGQARTGDHPAKVLIST